MNELFAKLFTKLGDIPAKIVSAYSLAALALLLLHFSLYVVPGIPDSTKPWLLSSTLVAAVVMVIVLRPSRPQFDLASESNGPTEFAGLRALIDSSSLPMYLTDSNLVILHCNSHLTSLVDSNESAIRGKHITELLARFGKRVPKERRGKFLKDQQALINKTMSDLSPHAERVEYVDNRSLAGSPYDDLYRVWIHADKVRCGQAQEEKGVFVVYKLTPIDEVPPAKKQEEFKGNN